MDLEVSKWVRRCFTILVGLTFFGYAHASGNDPEALSTTGRVTLSADTKIKKLTFAEDREFGFSVATGMRNDKLDWSIAGNNVDVLSELDWSDLDSYQVTLVNRSRFLRHIYCRTTFSYASIQNGTVRDSDYEGANRTLEGSRSVSETNGDEIWDFSTAGGYAFIMRNNRLLIAPILGVSYHKQNLRITNGTQVVSVSSDAPPIGPLSSQLNSTYFARWMGPWIGCDVHYLTEKRGADFIAMAFGLSVELHLADYYGEGNWNLRSDLDHPTSFEHEAHGYGIRISGEWLITLAENWELNFIANYQHWSTGSGTDRKFLSTGGSSVTRLNGAHWTSSSFLVGAYYHF